MAKEKVGGLADILKQITDAVSKMNWLQLLSFVQQVIQLWKSQKMTKANAKSTGGDHPAFEGCDAVEVAKKHNEMIREIADCCDDCLDHCEMVE